MKEFKLLVILLWWKLKRTPWIVNVFDKKSSGSDDTANEKGMKTEFNQI